MNLETYIDNLRDSMLITQQDFVPQNMDTRSQCIYCLTTMSAQKYGPYMERYIKDKFSLRGAENETSGDAISKYKMEIKVSLRQNNSAFNFVQLRPDHDVDYYLFLAYDLLADEVKWLFIPSDAIVSLILDYGNYAHGTIKANGPITTDNIYGKGYEYALRPNKFTKEGSKSNDLWNEITEYEINEENLMKEIKG